MGVLLSWLWLTPPCSLPRAGASVLQRTLRWGGAVEGETFEFTEMQFLSLFAEAKEERKNEAAIVFTHAMKAEEVHANLYPPGA